MPKFSFLVFMGIEYFIVIRFVILYIQLKTCKMKTIIQCAEYSSEKHYNVIISYVNDERHVQQNTKITRAVAQVDGSLVKLIILGHWSTSGALANFQATEAYEKNNISLICLAVALF